VLSKQREIFSVISAIQVEGKIVATKIAQIALKTQDIIFQIVGFFFKLFLCFFVLFRVKKNIIITSLFPNFGAFCEEKHRHLVGFNPTYLCGNIVQF